VGVARAVKIAIEVAPRTPELERAVEDLWVVILRAALERRAREPQAEPADRTDLPITERAASTAEDA
jgi:hypothetical protein